MQQDLFAMLCRGGQFFPRAGVFVDFNRSEIAEVSGFGDVVRITECLFPDAYSVSCRFGFFLFLAHVLPALIFLFRSARYRPIGMA